MSFDPEFLGVPAAAPQPRVERTVRLLPSTHFEVLLDPRDAWPSRRP
ncbi:hypothetical protein [Rathayibacter rathayi]|nr:hypothetical protein [Rathayibacter rathayi]